MSPTPTDASTVPAEVLAEIAHEQAHVDQVYRELAKAGERATMIETEGLARGRTDRVGDIRDEEISALFERDALVFNAGRRRQALQTEYEGLVFGRLDMEHDAPVPDGTTREVRYIGRLGVRDDDYEPLVIDWRAPAASPFYRATPVEPQGVVRRRVLRCREATVIGVEDDLMVPEAPDDMVIVGDGALLAALTRSRGRQMRDIVATIQEHQDQAIRASARGITTITGGPGTGKTVVALHRAAYLLYSDRRRYESGGILVIGPSAAYTAYIERVLPSLGEDTVTLRALGDVVDGMTATRLDSPAAAQIKGSLRIRQVLARAVRDVAPDAATELRTMIAGHPVRIGAGELRRVRDQVLRHHQHNVGRAAAQDALAESAWGQVRTQAGGLEKSEFLERFHDHLEVDAFVKDWWRPIDPREVLLWCADDERLGRYAAGLLSEHEREVLAGSMRLALELGTWTVADVALVDAVSARLALVQDEPDEERGFYEVEELDNLSDYGVTEVKVVGSGRQRNEMRPERALADPRERLLAGRIGGVDEYAHVLVDEAQDVSPMQWRMIGRRGRYASWTVVGDAAQSSWPDADEAGSARDEAFGTKPRQTFRMRTNYRNAREIFAYAADAIRADVPDADIPEAVRETGVEPLEVRCAADTLVDKVAESVDALLGDVEGSVAVIAPDKWRDSLQVVTQRDPARVEVIDPMSTKGLEWDATVVVDPSEITAESPGGIRVTYVCLTRAAHREHIVIPS